MTTSLRRDRSVGSSIGSTASAALASLIATRDFDLTAVSTPVRPASTSSLQLHAHASSSSDPAKSSQRSGPDQVEALRKKYGLPPSPQLGHSAASTAAAPREPVTSMGSSFETSSNPSAPPSATTRSLPGFGGYPAERRGRELEIGRRLPNLMTDESRESSRSKTFVDSCGETSIISRIQAFRRDVLGSVDGPAPREEFRPGSQVRGNSAPLQTSGRSGCRASPVLHSWHDAIGAAMSIGGAAVAATVAASQQGAWTSLGSSCS
jgi:hypothetical protein